MVQLAPGTMAVPIQHMVDVAGPHRKLPDSATDERIRLLPPVFLNVSVRMALDCPTATPPKSTDVGEYVLIGRRRKRWRGLDASLSASSAASLQPSAVVKSVAPNTRARENSREFWCMSPPSRLAEQVAGPTRASLSALESLLFCVERTGGAVTNRGGSDRLRVREGG